jgi:alkylation response protein AidB-like acyl-CoA dehydrogenase
VATTSPKTTTVSDLLGQVERLCPLIQEHAASAEADRRLTSVVYDAMFEAGLFAMQAPEAHGGLEFHPVETMQVLEAVARIDSAAAWNLSMNQAIPAYAAWLSAEGAQEIYRDGPTTMAGALNPPAAATRVEGGWRITGQCPFGSGCHDATWLAMPAVEMDGNQPKVDPATGQPTPFGVFFPRSEAKILDTWHTLGMRSTGSTDYAVEDLFVPDHLAVPVAPLNDPAPGFEGPLYRMWPFTAVLGEAVVSVGVAAAAVDAAVELCKTKTPAYNATPLREQQLAQFLMGKAKARVEASRDTLYRAAEAGYDDVVASGALLSVEAKIRLQLAVCFAAEACAEAVRWVNDAVGASSIRLGRPFERYFRDAHTLLQHSSKSRPSLRLRGPADVRPRERLGLAQLLGPFRGTRQVHLGLTCVSRLQ